jgi:hypothetical protein
MSVLSFVGGSPFVHACWAGLGGIWKRSITCHHHVIADSLIDGIPLAATIRGIRCTAHPIFAVAPQISLSHENVPEFNPRLSLEIEAFHVLSDIQRSPVLG